MFHMKDITPNRLFGGALSDWERIVLPEKISLEEKGNRKFLLQCIESLHVKARSGKKRFFLDFSCTKKIIAGGMLVLYAELKNLKNTDKYIQFKCSDGKTNQIRQVLKQTKIYALCRKKKAVAITRDDVVHWRVVTGLSAITDKYPDIIDKVEFENSTTKQYLFSACTEATINVKKHAYLEGYQRLRHVDSNKELWWSFSQLKDNILTVLVYDLGVSIPETIPKKYPIAHRFVRLFKGETDANLIRAGIEMPTSRTGKPNSGNGLPRIASLARGYDTNTVCIQSRHGKVLISNKGTACDNFNLPLHGTLISWCIDVRTNYESE